LGILILAFSFFSWFFLNNSLADGDNWVIKIVLPAVLFLILGSLIGFSYLVENDKKFLFFVPGFIILSFLPFAKPMLSFLVFGVLAALFLLLGVCQSIKEKESRINLAFQSIITRGLGPTLTGLVILASLIFYASPYSKSLGSELSVSRPFFDAVAAPLIGLFVDSNLPKDDLDRKEIVAQVQDEAYRMINQQLNLQGRAYKNFIPAGLATSFFFAIKIIGFLLMWVMLFLDWVAFKILRALQVVRIEKIQVEREMVEI